MMRKAALVLCGLLVVLSLASSLVTQAQEAPSQTAPAQTAGRALAQSPASTDKQLRSKQMRAPSSLSQFRIRRGSSN